MIAQSPLCVVGIQSADSASADFHDLHDQEAGIEGKTRI